MVDDAGTGTGPEADAADSSDIGLSPQDVTAIKNALIKSFVEGDLAPEDIALAGDGFISAFIDLDNQAFIRDEILSAQKKRLTQT
jgi:hypothetical protein